MRILSGCVTVSREVLFLSPFLPLKVRLCRYVWGDESRVDVIYCLDLSIGGGSSGFGPLRSGFLEAYYYGGFI